jgi:hypothetical protein
MEVATPKYFFRLAYKKLCATFASIYKSILS